MQHHQHVDGPVGQGEGPVGPRHHQIGTKSLFHDHIASGDLVGNIHHPADIAPLVVVPGIDLDLGAIDHHGGKRIDDRGAWVIQVVHRHQRPLFVAENASEFTLGRFSEITVDLFRRDGTCRFKNEIGQRGIEQRDTYRVTVQLAGQLREDLGDGLGRSGGGRDQRLATGTCAAQVFVALVDDGLGIGDVVDRGHAAMHDADLLVYHLDHRRQAVGGAGGRRDQMVLGRVVQVVIDAVHDVQCAFGRCSNNDLLYPLIEIGLQRLGLFVMLAGRLDHDVTARPVGFADGRIAAVCDLLATDDHCVAIGTAFFGPGAMHRVELEQVCRTGCIGRDLVHLDDGDTFPFPTGTNTKTTHAAEAVDTYANCHLFVLILLSVLTVYRCCFLVADRPESKRGVWLGSDFICAQPFECRASQACAR